LDTNIVIYVLKRRPLQVLSRFNEQSGRLAISAITLAELYHGAEKSLKQAQNTQAIEEFVSLLEVLPYTAKAAQHYGAIRAELESAGQMIGVNDLHIAAHGRSEGLVLVTNNESEFNRVTGLMVENWV
jgi:tRNA(fMet)-specific endonuclease VapC